MNFTITIQSEGYSFEELRIPFQSTDKEFYRIPYEVSSIIKDFIDYVEKEKTTRYAINKESGSHGTLSSVVQGGTGNGENESGS